MASKTPPWSHGLALFREGRYLDAHASFEALWRGARGPERDLYQGWVLLAAALFHRDRGNRRGARLCFQRAAEHWGCVPGAWEGLDLPACLEAVNRAMDRDWENPDLPGGGWGREDSS